jgi:hypothetical protein
MAPPAAWCGTCKTTMPQSVSGECVDCSSEPRRRVREDEPIYVARTTRPAAPSTTSAPPARIVLDFPEAFDSAVADLSPRQREIFSHYCNSNVRQSAIAKRLGLTRGAVSRIIDRIRAVFTRHGLPVPKHPMEPQAWGEGPAADVNTGQSAA